MSSAVEGVWVSSLHVQGCLVMDPSGRMTCEELLEHSFFDTFRDWFQPELEVRIALVW